MGVALDVSLPPTSWLKAAAEENPSMGVALYLSQPPTSWLKAAADGTSLWVSLWTCPSRRRLR